MKKSICYILSILFIINSIFLLNNTFGQLELWNTSSILNTNIDSTIDTNIWGSTIGNPIREWAYQIVHSDDWNYIIEWIVDSDTEITAHSTALDRTLGIIKRIINWALWLLSLVALVYLIVHWFMIITAAWDDTKYKKWMKWIKNAAIAIWGIWLSWFIISFIFRIINNITAQ